MSRVVWTMVMCMLFAAGELASALAAEFELRDGDRVVLLGNTLIERGQSYGYLETLLTSRFAERNVTFRNLGWSGDNVFGHARAGFDPPAAGYKQLLEQVAAAKPSVILIAYGGNEAFEGSAKLREFVTGLNRLLDDLSAGKPRVVLITPPPQENLGPPLPDPARQNENLREYARAISKVAAQRKLPLVDLFELLEGTSSQTGPLTDNGLHWTSYGYWHISGIIAQALGLPMDATRVTIDVASRTSQAEQGTLTDVKFADDRIQFALRSSWLPRSPSPDGDAAETSASHGAPVLTVRGLPEGDYALRIDGQPSVQASAAEWSNGRSLTAGPQFEQVEKLRQTVIAKNRLFFYRWRPQNQTYLFGFRKHEQGQNAKEIAEFDPLVAEQEKRIRQLAQPRVHKYELTKIVDQQ